MKAFDLKAAQGGAKVCTRDGRAVHLLTFGRKSDTHPLVGLVTRVGDEGVDTFKVDGKYYDNGDSRCDLFMAPTTHTAWINIYPTTCGHRFATEEEALRDAGGHTVATIKIEWEQ